MVSPPRMLAKQPWLYKLLDELKPKVELKEEFFGPSKQIFVGRSGYPKVFVGPSASLDNTPNNPGEMFGMNYKKIIETAAMNVRSKNRKSIFSPRREDKFTHENQLLTLAKKPTDVEIHFKKAPKFDFSPDNIVSPQGPSGLLKDFKITENVKIVKAVDRITNDELRAQKAAQELYKNGIEIYKIQQILSSGTLGQEKKKKLVPTRWSIVATQTMIMDKLVNEIKNYPSVNNYMVFSEEFLDNHYEILLMPGSWEFENFESWAPNSFWSQFTDSKIIQEYEPYEGRSDYADDQGGGYYGSKFGVCEGLCNLKRQARVVVFREVYEGYSIPVGQWQIVEAVRNAFKKNPKVFNSKKEALDHISSKIRIPVDEYVRKSTILKQRKLHDFF